MSRPRPREPAAGRLSLLELLRDLDQGRSRSCARATASSRTDELAAGHALGPPNAGRRGCSRPRRCRRRSPRGGPCDRPAQTPARFAVGDRVVTTNHAPGRPHAAAALRARQARHRRARARRARVPRFERAWAGREPAMALHGALLGAASSGARRPTRPRRSRSMPGRATLSRPEDLAEARSRAVAPIPRGDDGGPGLPRALGGAGFRDDARAARARAVHLAGMGRGARRRRSSRAQGAGRPATTARPITATGWRRSSASRPTRASPRRRRSRRAAPPGTAPPTRRRTARRSCWRTTRCIHRSGVPERSSRRRSPTAGRGQRRRASAPRPRSTSPSEASLRARARRRRPRVRARRSPSRPSPRPPAMRNASALAKTASAAIAPVVSAVPSAMAKVAAMPAANTPAPSAKTRTMIAPAQGRMPAASTTPAARASASGG